MQKVLSKKLRRFNIYVGINGHVVLVVFIPSAPKVDLLLLCTWLISREFFRKIHPPRNFSF